jgi:hypothetical protein
MERVYRDYWPDHQGVLSNDVHNDAQHAGADRLIYLWSAKPLSIEEKIRRGFWRDVLLEFISNSVTKAPGWVTKKNGNDFLVYALPEMGRYRMLPQEPLYQLWRKRGAQWTKWAETEYGGFKIRESGTRGSNGGYKSQSVAVPEHVMVAEFGRACLRTILPARADEVVDASTVVSKASREPGPGLVSLRPTSPQLELPGIKDARTRRRGVA